MSEEKNESQVLVVDDSRVIRRAAVKILQKEFDVIEAEDGEDAWDELQQNKNISVVFTDLGMPNMDGFELLEKIRNADDPALASMPVIIITGAEESEGAREEVLELGATDFISKPFDSVSLKSRASAHINYRNEVQSLEKRAATDRLTGLLTETSFLQQGEQALAYARRHCTQVTVVRFDIDHFAELFVKHGKDVAEQILAKVASFIREGMRTEDTGARLGVSRFALLLPCSDPAGAIQVITRIRDRVAKLKLKLGSDVFHIRFSTGITSPDLSADDITFNHLVEQAESSLKQAIDLGGGQMVRYQSATTPAAASADLSEVEVNLDKLVQQLAKEDSSVSQQQLASAMRKLLPIMVQADQQLKLGLSKVILHLKNKLKP
ncbi:MAG: response regulator [Gammaproteobacteria bacterium]|nr:response regulator [Gammaproteobacteria bacterium]